MGEGIVFSIEPFRLTERTIAFPGFYRVSSILRYGHPIWAFRLTCWHEQITQLCFLSRKWKAVFTQHGRVPVTADTPHFETHNFIWATPGGEHKGRYCT